MRTRLPAAILLFLIVSAALAVWLSPCGYAIQDRDATMAAPSARHMTGTDALGRDRTLRVSAALLIGIIGSAIAATFTTMIATGFGLLAAFSSPWLAASLMFVSDVFLSLPWLFLLMMARSLLPLTASPLETGVTTFLVLAALGWPACAKAIYRGAMALGSAECMIH